MPAEWEPHQATWLTWPHNEAHWPGKFEKIEPIFARMARELSAGEDVHIAIHDDATQQSAEKHLKAEDATSARIHLHRIPNNFAWARDHGPIFVKNEKGERKILDWVFNGWGNQWAHELDDDVPQFVSRATGVPAEKVPMVLEGGSIDVNGAGTLITTESCLLNPNRNPSMNKAQIEATLKQRLGVSHVIWLTGEIAGDDTSGHVDDMTRFIGPRTVMTVIAEDPADENYKALRENLAILEKSTDQDGQPLTVIPVPLPEPVIYDGMRLPASYANFYIGNEVILLPTYNCPQDRFAMEVLKKAFPNRRVVGIDGTDLIWGLGSFHCLTQQMPA